MPRFAAATRSWRSSPWPSADYALELVRQKDCYVVGVDRTPQMLAEGRRRVALATVGTVFLVGPMWLTPMGHLVELSATWWQTLLGGAYTLTGVVTMVVLWRMAPPGESRHAAETKVSTPDAQVGATRAGHVG